jgi:hypothetical protein
MMYVDLVGQQPSVKVQGAKCKLNCTLHFSFYILHTYPGSRGMSGEASRLPLG